MEENRTERSRSIRKLYLPKISSNVTTHEQTDRNTLVSQQNKNIQIYNRQNKKYFQTKFMILTLKTFQDMLSITLK